MNDTTKSDVHMLDNLPGSLFWQCNLCGAANVSEASSMDRESGGCNSCGAVMRFRTIAAVLAIRLFGETKIFKQLPSHKGIKGIGLSDSDIYAQTLANKFNYANTYYHCEPFLDIGNIPEDTIGDNNFLITSDVFEHICQPLQQAFDNLYKLLAPGGALVFSVPFSLDDSTKEHFPDLHDFSIVEESDGWVMHNTTKAGVRQTHTDLIFHGGPGSTLEMRLFCKKDLLMHLEKAGFRDVRIHNEPYFEFGIFWLHPWSLIISAIK